VEPSSILEVSNELPPFSIEDKWLYECYFIYMYLPTGNVKHTTSLKFENTKMSSGIFFRQTRVKKTTSVCAAAGI